MTDEELRNRFDSLRMQGTKTNKKRTEADLKARFDYLQSQGTQQLNTQPTQPVVTQPVVEPTPQVVTQPVQPVQQPIRTHGQVAQQGLQQAQEKIHATEKPMTAKLQSGQALTPEETIRYAQEQGKITSTEANKKLKEIKEPLKNVKIEGKDNSWTIKNDIQEFKDTIDTIGKGTVVFGARALDALDKAKNYASGNDTSIINPNNLANYINGKRDTQSRVAFSMLRQMAQRSDRQDDMDLQNLYNAIAEGRFTGNAEDIKNILNKSQIYQNNKQYQKLVQPSLEKYEQRKQQNIEQYPGMASTIMNTGSDILSHGIPTVLGMAANPTAGLALSGGVTGETKMQQYLAQGKDYTEAAKNIPIETAKGLAFGKILEVASPILSAGITPDTSTLARIGFGFSTGLGVGAVAGGITQLFDQLKDDPDYDYIDWNKVQKGINEGRYKTLEDYTGSKEFAEDVAKSRKKQILISAIATAVFNGANQGMTKPQTTALTKKTETDMLTRAKADKYLKTLGLKEGATQEQVKSAFRSLSKQYHPDINPGDDEPFKAIAEAYNALTKNPQYAFVFGEGVAPTATTINTTQTAPTTAGVTNTNSLVTQQPNAVSAIYTPNLTPNINAGAVTQAANAIQNGYNALNLVETPKEATQNVDINSRNNYNKIVAPEYEGKIYSSSKITNKEAAQLTSELADVRTQQEDGTHYIDLSKEGYYSYIYEKHGNEITPIKKLWGDEKALNEIRKGIENGTYREYETIDKWIRTARTRQRNNSNNNSLLRQPTESGNDAGLYSGGMRQENQPDSINVAKQSSQDLKNSEQGSFLVQENKGIPSYLNDLGTYTNHHVERELNNETRQPRFGIPKVRKGWNIDKIQKQLKSMSSRANSGSIVLSYDTPEELSENIYYHGANSVNSRLKAGSTVPEGNRNGGYGDEYHSISLSKSKNIASNFAGPMTGNGVVYPVVLHKNANVIEMPEIQDAIDLEEMLPELWEKGVDAVKIGDWNDGYSEQELVVLNPHAITTITNSPYVEYVKQYGKPKYQNMSLEEVKGLQEHYKQQMDKNRLEHIDKLKTKQAKDSTMLPPDEEIQKVDKKELLPTTDELKQFEQGRKQAEIEAVRKGAKALGLEKEPAPPVEPPKPPTEPPTEPEEIPDYPDDKIAQLLKEKPQRAKMTKKEMAENAYKTLVNKGYYVDKLAEESGNPQLKYKYDRMLASANEGNYVVGEKQTDNKGNIIGKSVNEIWKPVEDAGKVEEFSDYLLHKLNINRMSLEDIDAITKADTDLTEFIKNNPEIGGLSPNKLKKLAKGDDENAEKARQLIELDKQAEILENRKNKPVFGETVTADDSRKIVAEYEKNNPEFVEWSKDISTFNKNQLQNMVDAGLASEETQQLLNDMYDNYIRIQREVGGDRPIVNQRGRLKVNSPIKKAKGGNQDILPLKDSMAQQAVEVKKAISRNLFGQELLSTIGGGEEVEDYGEILNKGKNGETPTFTVFKEGKPVTMKINTELYDTIKPSERATWEDGVIANGLQKAVVLQKTLLTSRNPIFAFTNFVRDLQTAIVNSTDTPKMLNNYRKLAQYKFAQTFGRKLTDEQEEIGRLWELYKANGGESNTYFDFEKGTNLESSNPVKRGIDKFTDKVFGVNEIVEQMPRVAEFITTLENGGTIDEAMYNAADITVNFKRGGEFTKMLDRNGASFLNASVQGLDKQIRNFSKKRGGKGFAKMVITCALLGIAPQLLNHVLLSDDEDYQDLPDYVKDNYWLFKTGDDTFIRIPRGRDIPTFLGVLAQRTKRATEGDDHAFDGLVDTFGNTLAPNNPIEDNIFAPWAAVKNNKSWSGNDIVSSALSNKVPSEQYDAKDTEFAKWLAASKLGKQFGWSPKKIDYLLDQYSGGIGDILIPMNTKYAEEGNPLSAKFMTDSVSNNKQLSRFYDDKTELAQRKSSGLTNDEENFEASYYNNVANRISGLNEMKRSIEMSDKSDKEKIAEVREITKQINEEARTANKTVKELGKKYNDYMADDAFADFILKTSEDKTDEEKQAYLDKNARLYSYKDVLGGEYAIGQLDDSVQEKYENSGVDADIFFDAYMAQSKATGDKDNNGKTIPLSKATNQKEAIDDAVGDDLSKAELEQLYGIFNISEKVW